MELLKKNKHPHPLIYMRGIMSEDLVAIMDFLYNGEANVFQDSLDAFLALAEILKLKGLSGGAEAEEKSVKETPRPQGRIDQSMKQEIDEQVFPPKSNFIFPSSYESTVALTNSKLIVEDIEDMDKQIKSLITKTDIPSSKKGNWGNLTTCNICGKQDSYTNMQRHIEAKHISGLSHACAICDKTFRTRASLSDHKSKYHKSI